MDIPETLLRRLDVPGPRYTSYPTADRFVEAFGPAEYAQALRQRADGATVGGNPPLSIYVHIPFCESVCYYCACNKVITKHHERAGPYLDALAAEIDLHTAELGVRQPVTQLHLGGGTPTFLSDAELARLMQMLRSAFAIADTAEISIEVDPRTADPQRLASLAGLGFNRLSFGVPGLHPVAHRLVLAALRCRGLAPTASVTTLGRIMLLPHQEAAVRWLRSRLSRFGGALLADPPGLGKTYVALAVASERGVTPLVIAPAALAN